MSDGGDLVRRQFGAHAADYVTSTVHAQGESLARLVELTNPQATWLVLDVSTGAGHTALAFAPHVAHVVATDITPQMLEAARMLAQERRLTNVEFRPADAQRLPFDSDYFNLVTNRIALHHYADMHAAIREMARVCQPGGLIALVDNVVPSEEHTAAFINRFETLRDPSHHWAYSLAQLEAAFTAAQLAVAHCMTLPKQMEFEPWVRRMGASEATRAELRTMLLDAPAGARAFLAPRLVDDRLFFTLTEAIVIGQKASANSVAEDGDFYGKTVFGILPFK
jgi:ubiquinone/menaquinone biosynthesis C-methylase UbiE